MRRRHEASLARVERLEPRCLISASPDMALASPAGSAAALAQSLVIGRPDTPGGPVVRRVALTDLDGTVIAITLAGTGDGSASINDAGLVHLDLQNTAANTRLTLTTKGGDGRARLGGAVFDGPIGGLTAARVDLAGAIHIGGRLAGKLILGDVVAPSTIQLGGAADDPSAGSIALGRAADLALQSGAPLRDLTLIDWLDHDDTPDTLSAPALGRLTVKGARGVAAGDLDAVVTLGAAGVSALRLATANIAGTWRGDALVTGNVGALRAARLRGRLEITGDARSITLAEPLAIGQVRSATGGVLRLHGSGRISSAGASLTASDAELYTAGPGLYQLDELLRFNVASQARFESSTSDSTGLLDSSLLNLAVTGAPAGAVAPAPHAAASSAAAFVMSHQSRTMLGAFAWADDPRGVLIERRFAEADGSLSYHFEALPMSGDTLALGQTFTASSPVQLSVQISRPTVMSGELNGQSNVTTRLLGHEIVTTPAGLFLAARLSMVVSANVIGSLNLGDQSIPTRVTGRTDMTLWCVPGIGVVKAHVADTASLLVPGLGATKALLSQQWALAAPQAHDAYAINSLTDQTALGVNPFGAPTINDAGATAFDGWLNVQRGIWRVDAGVVTNVVMAAQTWLSEIGSVFNLGAPVLDDHGAVTFYGTLAQGAALLRQSAEGVWSIVARQGDDDGEWHELTPVFGVAAHGAVAFRAVDADGGQSLVRIDDGVVQTLLDRQGGLRFLDGLATNDAGAAAAVAVINGVEGLYRIENCSVTTIARRGAATRGGPRFRGFDPAISINESGAIVFHGYIGAQTDGVYLADATGVHAIAGGGRFEHFQSVALNDMGEVAFLAVLKDGDAGIYTGPDSVYDKVIAVGDRFLGSWVTNLALAPTGLNSAGQVAFTYQLADGRTGVAVASLA